MLQPLTPAVGSKVGQYSLAAEAPEALSAPSFVGRAEDGRLVRLLLLSRAGVDVEAVQRAVGQAKSLSDAHVLQVLEAEPVEGRIALAFEHVEGVSLQTLISAAGSGGLARGVALRIALDVLEGLAAAHGAGHPHGEVGPHLVLLGTDGKARVIGAGVARALGKALAPKTPSDRLAYVAPERVKVASTGNAPAVDPKSDVFSAAVLVWELLAHQRLFAGRLESAVIQKVLTATVAPLASSADDLPDGIDELLKKALERDPSRRSASARELADGLAAACQGVTASHEEVASAVKTLAKQAIEELRARVAEAAANGAGGAGSEVSVPAPRASFPTLDESWVESIEEAPKPAARPKLGVPPKPPPRLPVKIGAPRPGELKAPEIKLGAPASVRGSDAKAEEAKAEEAKAGDAKAAAADVAEEKAGDEAAGDAKGADAKGAPDAKGAAPKPTPPRVPLRRGPIALPKPGAKRPPENLRKGTLLGMAPPALRADGTKAPESEKAASTSRSPSAPADAEIDVPVEVEAAEASPPSAGEAVAEAAAPKSSRAPLSTKPTPVAGPPMSSAKPPLELEATPSSGPPSLGEKKRRPMPGNLQPGDALGRYELLLPVAAGGMAAVWAARLQGTAGFQKIVAIKTMLPGLSADQDFEEMFLDEARVAARIRHPNVVEIFDLGEEDETLYLVMEWVEGETLGALQKGSKPHGGIPLPILLRLASQACAGLHAAHELRDDKGALVDLVHRDISPANILVSRTGFVKIVDFGVAKSKARMYTTRVGGMIKGKTPYLSPEQLAGQPIDRRSDLYSFGAVLYVLATGLHPFRGETEAKTIENIALRDPVPLRKIDPNLDAELEAIVLKALQKDRDLRYQSASEMQRAIDTLAASIGQAVNDDDVAAFVKTVSGEGLEKRAVALRESIATADIGKAAPLARNALPSESKLDGASDAAKAEGAAAGDDAAKVEIDDVDVDADEAAARKLKAGDEAAATGEGALNALSLGSDGERASPPDTLAAASAEPSDEPEVAPNRRRRALVAVASILGVCALIGAIAIAQSGGEPSGQGKGAQTASAIEPARTGAVVEPTAAESATAAPATTEAPAASVEPTTTEADPSAAPETSAAPEPSTAPTVAAAKPTPVTRPFTKPVTKPVTKPTGNKPPVKFEPNTL